MQGEQREKRQRKYSTPWVRLWCGIWCACLCVMFAAEKSHAAGFLVPSIGSRASSMGGAFIAGGDDLTTIWHNPANLARLGGLRVLLDGAFVWIPFSFTRAPINGKSPFPTSNNVGMSNPSHSWASAMTLLR